jgi:FtsH-binding integral membrane protein
MPYEYAPDYRVAAQVESTERAAFIRRTYAHLAGAILAFVGLEAVLVNVIGAQALAIFSVPYSAIFVLIAFMAAGWVANVWARSETSVALQYCGLALYVVVEAFIFLPILYYAQYRFHDETIIPTAGILTLCVFGGLTASVFVTRKDFSFLGPIVSIGCMIALGLIVASFLFGLNLGLFFAFAMVGLMSAAILYQTSNILLYYRTDQHVAAALGLFASVATMFWYILRILMIMRK